MMMFLKKYINALNQEPLVFFVGICVLSLAVMGTSIRHVSSTVFTLLVLLSFASIRSWYKVFSELSKVEKVFVCALLLYAVSGVLSFYNADDTAQYFKLFERYLRFVLVIPLYFYLIKNRLSVINFLYIGAVISGPFLFVIALRHYLSFPDAPAQGYYHHIIFGQLAMLNVGIMLAILLTKKLNRLSQLLIILSMLCGMTTAVLSQARGVWLVFPVYIMVTFFYVLKEKRISASYIVIFLVSLVLLSIVTPIGQLIQQRTAEGLTEINRFYEKDQYVSSVGTRLAMWEIAIDVWKRHPVLGTGLGDFDDEVMALQRKGDYQGMDVHNSVHNIYIQALVGSGIVGLLALCFMFIMPLVIIFGKNNRDETAKLTGFMVVSSFAVFGLSESWILRLSIISIFLIYIVVISSHVALTRHDDRTDVIR